MFDPYDRYGRRRPQRTPTLQDYQQLRHALEQSQAQARQLQAVAQESQARLREREAQVQEMQARLEAQARAAQATPAAELQARLSEHEAQVQELQAKLEAQAQSLRQTKQEMQIKEEALRRQGDDLKRTEAELLFAKGALQQAETEQGGESVEDWKGRVQALQREMEGLRRRLEQRYEAETAEARRAILRDMLPLADHLEMALEHSRELSGEAAQAFVGSIETTRQAFLDTLRRYGVTPIQALGAPFDPALHEAVGYAVVDGVPPDHVAQVVQTGYVEDGKLVRPARVLVSRG